MSISPSLIDEKQVGPQLFTQRYCFSFAGAQVHQLNGNRLNRFLHDTNLASMRTTLESRLALARISVLERRRWEGLLVETSHIAQMYNLLEPGN